MRSSYSTPSRFISVTRSVLALSSWAARIAPGFSRTDSMTDNRSSACSGASRSMFSITSSANSESGWLSANSSWRSTVTRTVRPSSSGVSRCSTTSASSSDRYIEIARRICPRWALRVSWLSCSSPRTASQPPGCSKSPCTGGRSSRFNSIWWLTLKLDTIGSGEPFTSLSKVSSVQWA